MSEIEGMNNSLSVGNLIDVLKEFPRETPVFFVSTTPDNQFEVSCEYFNDFIEVDGVKESAVVFLYKPMDVQEDGAFEVGQPELDFEE